VFFTSMLAGQQQVFVVEEVNTDRTCCQRGEKQYRIRDGAGAHDLFTAKEQLDLCCRQCFCVCRRDFDLFADDKAGDPVVMHHHTMCCSWFHCLPCCRHRMHVSRKDKPIGYVRSDCHWCCTCFPTFTVFDEKEKEIYTIGKDVDCCARMCGGCGCCCCHCAVPQEYSIKGHGEGKIEDVPMGQSRTNQFIVKFPVNATEDHRMLLVAGTFLVDYTGDDARKKRRTCTCANEMSISHYLFFQQF